MQLGYHLSIQGGLAHLAKRIQSTKSNTFQIFSRSPRGGQAKKFPPKDVELFRKEIEQLGVKQYAVHMPYVYNPASSNPDLYNKARRAIQEDIERASLLGAQYVVIHPGAHTGGGEEQAIVRLGSLLNEAIKTSDNNITVLIEIMTGAGTEIGFNIQQLGRICSYVDQQERVGVCLDSCHMYAGGYDLRNVNGIEQVIREIDCYLGMDKVKLVHLNDCKKELGSKRDLHDNIGDGQIGLLGFKTLINHPKFRYLPFIMETPDIDEKNMNTVLSLRERHI